MFHPQEVWLTKDANVFLSKNLTLIPEQRKELESDLLWKSFLKDYEKNPGYKTSFGFKTKMFVSMRSKRTSLVPLFKLRDLVTKVKLQVDDTLNISGAAVILDGDPEVGGDIIPKVF